MSPSAVQTNAARQKARARKQARRAFPVLTNCEHCSTPTGRLERHHPDPGEPLTIIVLCKKCHVAEHKRTGVWGPLLAPTAMRVAESIAGRIERGELRPGDKLPPEQAIADEYQVAYSTVRRAMKELRERGLIETRWGYGTFVASRPGER